MAKTSVSVSSFLAKLRNRSVIPIPKEPETLAELVQRIGRQGRAAEIKKPQYFEFLARSPPCVRLPYCYFIHDEVVRFYWLDLTGEKAFACELTECETKVFAQLFRAEPLFQSLLECSIGDLLTGEKFVTLTDNEVGQVAKERPEDPNSVVVWLVPDSIMVRKEVWPSTTRVLACSAEQATRIARRVKNRQRRAQKRTAETGSSNGKADSMRSSSQPYPQTDSQVLSTERRITMATKKPEKSYRIGSISAAVFVNTNGNGDRQFRSVQLQRNYKDGEDWKTSTSFTLADLPCAIRVLERALEYVESKEVEVST